MPAFTLHGVFGYDVKDKLFQQEIKAAVDKNPGIFYAGCQGPDLFFYNPFFSRSKMQSLGSIMHEKNTSAFFASLMEELSIQRKKQDVEIGISYLLGFLAHYTLDTQMHPYVYGRVGYQPEKGEGNDITLGKHLKLEAVLEMKVMNQRGRQVLRKKAPRRLVQADRKRKKQLAKMMIPCLEHCYPVRLRTSHIMMSYWCMERVVGFLYGFRPWFRILFSKVETLFHGEAFFSNMMVDSELEDAEDALNRRRSSWANPWKPTFLCHDTVSELYQRGIARYQSYYLVLEPVLTKIYRRTDSEHAKQKQESPTSRAKLMEEIRSAAQQLENLDYHSGMTVQ